MDVADGQRFVIAVNSVSAIVYSKTCLNGFSGLHPEGTNLKYGN